MPRTVTRQGLRSGRAVVTALAAVVVGLAGSPAAAAGDGSAGAATPYGGLPDRAAVPVVVAGLPDGVVMTTADGPRLAAYRAAFRPDPRLGADPGPGLPALLRALLDSRPGERVPDPALTTTALGTTGEVRALLAVDGSHLMVWTSHGAPFHVDTTKLTGDRLRGWWFDPRSGTPIDIGSVQRRTDVDRYPPVTGPHDEGLDWVLVVDDAAREFGPPGRTPSSDRERPEPSPVGSRG